MDNINIYNNKRSYQDSTDLNNIQKKQCIKFESINDYSDTIYLEDDVKYIYNKLKFFLNSNTEIITECDDYNLKINCSILRISDHCVLQIKIFKTDLINNYIIACKQINGDKFMYSYIIYYLYQYFTNNNHIIINYGETNYSNMTPPIIYHQSIYMDKTNQLISILNMISSTSVHISIDGIKYLIEFFHKLSLNIDICHRVLINYDINKIFTNIIQINKFNYNSYDWYYVYILKVIYEMLIKLSDKAYMIFIQDKELIDEIKSIVQSDTNKHAVNLAKNIILLIELYNDLY